MSAFGRYIEQDEDANLWIVVDTYAEKFKIPAREILTKLISDHTDFVDKVAREVIESKLG